MKVFPFQRRNGIIELITNTKLHFSTSTEDDILQWRTDLAATNTFSIFRKKQKV
jgi:hypothetical protein